MDATDFIGSIFEYGKQNGFAAVCLFAVCVAVVKSVRWFGAEILKPLLNDFCKPLFARLMRFVDAAESLATRQADDVTQLKADLRLISDRQTEHMKICGNEPAGCPS